MFWYLMDVLALKKLGLARPLRYVFLLAFAISLCLGVVYACVVLHAVSERNNRPHVSTHSSR